MALHRDDPVRAGLHIQRGAVPMESILARGVAGPIEPARVVPHLEKVIRGIKPHAIIEERGQRQLAMGHFQRRLRFQDGVALVTLRVMKDAPEVRFLDEEIIHEKLPAHIDRNDFRRMHKIRHRGGPARGSSGSVITGGQRFGSRMPL